MKKRKPRGIRLKLVFAIMFIFVSIVAVGSTYNDTIQSSERSYEKGDQFEGESIGITYVKLEALEELDIVDKELDEDEKFYMVEHENGFVILKATQDDIKKLIHSSDVPERKIINLKLLDKFNDAEKHSSLIKNRVSDVLKEEGSNKTEAYYKKLQEKPFVSNVYLTVPGYLYYIGTYVFTTIFVLGTLFLITSIIKDVRKSRG